MGRNSRVAVRVDGGVVEGRGLNRRPHGLVQDEPLGLVDGLDDAHLAVDRLEHVVVQTLAAELDLEGKDENC